MDHDTARLLLAFRRPGGPDELTPDDAAALARHLDSCPACAAAARHQDAFDAAVGAAMAAAPVPGGLRDRLVAAGLARRGADLRRSVYRAATGAAAALVTAALVFGVYRAQRPEVDTAGYVAAFDAEAEFPEQTVRDWLVRRGLPGELPYDFDYQYYVAHGEEEVAGRDAPVVTFVTWQPNRPGPDKARVYVLPESKFDLRSPRMRNAVSSFANAEVVHGRGVAYLVVYTSESVAPFLRPNTGRFARVQL